MREYKSYSKYKEDILERLSKATEKKWEAGVWKRTGTPLPYILPVADGDTPDSNRRNRAEAIFLNLGFDCTKCLGKQLIGLHPYAHHLTSSQLLCMMFFGKLIDTDCRATEKLVEFMKCAFKINIHAGAKCSFEHTEKRAPYLFDVDRDGVLHIGKGFYEGTSFDFHIKDGEVEVYFEIKFTEQGFKKEKADKRHVAKVEAYLNIDSIPPFTKGNVISVDDFLNQYQIY